MSLDMLRTIVQWLGIPLQLFIGFVALQVTLHFLEVRQGWWNIVLLYVVHLITMNAIVYVGDYAPPLLMVPGFVGALCLLCKGPLSARFSMGMLLVLLPLSLNALLTNVRPPFDVFYYVYIALLWCGILLFVHKALPSRTKPPIRSGRLWALIDLLALMPFGSVITVLALTQMVYVHSDPDPFYDQIYIQNERALLIILALAAIAALGLLVAVVVLARHERLEDEQMLWQIRSQYYQNLEQTQNQVKHLRHDMANHLTAMAGLDDTGMRTYLEGLINAPAMSSGRRFCENNVVNAVLSSKAAIIEREEIAYTIDVNVPSKVAMDDIDLCALFANGLDNAIEASYKLPPEERSVEIKSKVDNGFLLLELTNRFSGELIVKHGRIDTNKQNQLLHGFGLKGIQEIAERYSGSCQVEHSESQFQLLVVIPILPIEPRNQ